MSKTLKKALGAVLLAGVLVGSTGVVALAGNNPYTQSDGKSHVGSTATTKPGNTDESNTCKKWWC